MSYFKWNSSSNWSEQKSKNIMMLALKPDILWPHFTQLNLDQLGKTGYIFLNYPVSDF